jgi:hypothetical protein
VKARGTYQVKLSLSASPLIDWTVVLGDELSTMSVQEWNRLLLNKYIVFARFPPIFCVIFHLIFFLVIF